MEKREAWSLKREKRGGDDKCGRDIGVSHSATAQTLGFIIINKGDGNLFGKFVIRTETFS